MPIEVRDDTAVSHEAGAVTQIAKVRDRHRIGLTGDQRDREGATASRIEYVAAKGTRRPIPGRIERLQAEFVTIANDRIGPAEGPVAACDEGILPIRGVGLIGKSGGVPAIAVRVDVPAPIQIHRAGIRGQPVGRYGRERGVGRARVADAGLCGRIERDRGRRSGTRGVGMGVERGTELRIRIDIDGAGNRRRRERRRCSEQGDANKTQTYGHLKFPPQNDSTENNIW